MTLAMPPENPESLADFPNFTVQANQPLARIHREIHDTAFFCNDQSGRFDPPERRASDFGTCFLSTLPLGAFVEVFGRINPIHRRDVDERVLADVYLPSDAILANVTDRRVLGDWGLTAEINTTSDYGICQEWASSLQLAGFSGVLYAASRDPGLVMRSVALFGKPGADPEAFVAKTRPIPRALEEEARARFGLRILPASRLN